ncbi:hypothetical protein [Nonomuraea antimicrobica]|uniref:hypothetical protein n=1 Tax=Nonomuraea antimicrobica TaxID=561173 RepID=UPI0031E5AFA2
MPPRPAASLQRLRWRSASEPLRSSATVNAPRAEAATAAAQQAREETVAVRADLQAAERGIGELARQPDQARRLKSTARDLAASRTRELEQSETAGSMPRAHEPGIPPSEPGPAGS